MEQRGGAICPPPLFLPEAHHTMNISLKFENYQIRMTGTHENPEWVAKDVCDLLGYRDYENVLKRMPKDEKGLTICETLGGPQQMSTVTEPGLYRLIFGSKLPAARSFQNFVFREVLPSIRKNGFYTAEKTLSSRYLALTRALQSESKMFPRDSHKFALKLLQLTDDDQKIGDLKAMSVEMIKDGGDPAAVARIRRKLPKLFAIYQHEKSLRLSQKP